MTYLSRRSPTSAFIPLELLAQVKMYAFKVSVNGEPPVVGGASDLGVLTAILTGTGRLGPDSVPHRNGKPQDFFFRLGGLTARAAGQADEHLEWLQIDEMKLGDTVTIEIVETRAVHSVTGGISQADQHAHDERKYFEHCKKTYFEMRSKFEDEDGSSDRT